MFNTYSYKTLPLAGIKRNKTYKNKFKLYFYIFKFDQNALFAVLQIFLNYFNYGYACIHLFSVF